MAKRTIFSLPVSSLRRSLRALISLVAILCSIAGMLMYPFSAFAASHVTIIINDLSKGKSANVLFKGKPLGANCVTEKGSRIVGDVNGAGMFSVNFYPTSDCTGTREQLHSYQVKQGSPGGLVVCNSDTDCFYNDLTNSPFSKNDAIATVLFKGLGNAKGANVLFDDVQKGECITADKIKSGKNMVSTPLTANGMFSVNFFSNTNCTGGRNNPFFRFNAPQGSNGIFVTCNSDTDCK